MNVPFRLIRRPSSAPASGLWVASADRAALAAAAGRVGGDFPEVFAVAGGFVAVFSERVPPRWPGAVPLRRLGGHLFVPASADLSPALHLDEIVALTRDRGVLLLPGGAALAFDLAAPLSPADLAAPAAVRRSPWQPPAAPPPLAETLHSIRSTAELPPAAILEAGEPDGAGEPLPRPAAGTPVGRVVGGALMGLGRLLHGLGRLFGSEGVARRGAEMIRRAVDAVPRLTEGVLGKQEAALRELLRRFQAGDIEAALRQAPVAVADSSGPAAPLDAGSQLSRHDARYSLAGLLGGGGGGGTWLGGGNVWHLLAEEYRRVARAAMERGDHRRAAYVYGVLLRDIGAAARALFAGGLYRDAAVLYRDRLNDHHRAADAFERAGDVDEALHLYEGAGLYAAAGDLLRRVGMEEAALDRYFLHTERLASDRRWVEAADFVRQKVGRNDLATAYLRTGWAATDLASGTKLVELTAAGRDWPALAALLTEAEEVAPAYGLQDVGALYGAFMRAVVDAPDAVADAVRDRVRLALGATLASYPPSKSAAVVSQTFGRGDWPAAVAADAAAALARPFDRRAVTSGPLAPASGERARERGKA